jgi:hypothetical protein
MKSYTKCNKLKSENQFSLGKSGQYKNKLFPICQSCLYERLKKYRKENQEKLEMYRH